MKKAKTPRKLLPFDAARYLTDEAAIAEYMTAVLEANEPDLLLLALGDIARARGMSQIAKETGLPVHIAENPLSCVVLGSGKILDNFDTMKDLLINYRLEV